MEEAGNRQAGWQLLGAGALPHSLSWAYAGRPGGLVGKGSGAAA